MQFRKRNRDALYLPIWKDPWDKWSEKNKLIIECTVTFHVNQGKRYIFVSLVLTKKTHGNIMTMTVCWVGSGNPLSASELTLLLQWYWLTTISHSCPLSRELPSTCGEPPCLERLYFQPLPEADPSHRMTDTVFKRPIEDQFGGVICVPGILHEINLA